jgi:hypothetical protein
VLVSSSKFASVNTTTSDAAVAAASSAADTETSGDSKSSHADATSRQREETRMASNDESDDCCCTEESDERNRARVKRDQRQQEVGKHRLQKQVGHLKSTDWRRIRTPDLLLSCTSIRGVLCTSVDCVHSRWNHLGDRLTVLDVGIFHCHQTRLSCVFTFVHRPPSSAFVACSVHIGTRC